MTTAQMSGAEFSGDQQYRHLLWRVWDESLPLLCLVMLNPSKAGAIDNDPTVTRQIERAKRLGFGGLLVVNAFDLIATDPRELKRHEAPLSMLANVSIINAVDRTVESGGTILVAWGGNCTQRRHNELVRMLSGYPLKCLGVNFDGSPVHPLYIPYSAPLLDWPVV